MRKRGKMRRMLKVLLTLALLALAAFLLALMTLTVMEKSVPAPKGDSEALIVLGAQVKSDGQLSLQLEGRLQAALSTYREKQRPIVVCGAQGKNEPEPEAFTMRRWLLENGVSENDVIAEAASYDTLQNLKNARALLPEEIGKVTVVTSDYHLPRALFIARDAGLTADGIGSATLPEYWIKNHAREVLAWGKYFLNKIVPLS